MRKILNILFHRLVVVAFGILIQIIVLLAVILCFSDYFVQFYFVCVLISAAVVLWLVSSPSNPAYKIAWLIPIMAFPVFGGVLYLVLGGSKLSNRTRRRMSRIEEEAGAAMRHKSEVLRLMEERSVDAANQSRYIRTVSDCPAQIDTSVTYFPLGEDKFASMLEELKKAKRYIFLEYFIIEEGEMWNSVLEILAEKAAQGVDVRVLYDDIGCMMTLPQHYEKTLEAMGISCAVFNPFLPVLSLRLNNRDHRKICVIDGLVGYTGGINLADEYINKKVRFGHWKDSAVMLKGDAVWNLTVMFLSIWNYIHNKDEDYSRYLPREAERPEAGPENGFVQPFSDTPLDDEPVGENVYLNLISKAKRYVYITTPYLIIDNSMMAALCTAARAGVDVRIMTPHIPDKKIIFEVTRAHYPQLLEAGVKIYEYTPGFLHAKNFVVDDQYGVVGTINLDYRSLYLHFECGVWIYQNPAVLDIRDDFLRTQDMSQQVCLEQATRLSWLKRLWRALLRAFAPLM